MITTNRPFSQLSCRVTACLKKPSLNPDDNSFSPISNLTFLSKIIERIATKQLILHADQNELFPARQSAYRRFHSTESAVLVVHNDIIRVIDEGHVVALALLDLSSAFDTVDHPTLLSILQSRFSVTGQPLDWFRSSLTGRTQVFTTHSGHILPVSLISGVPQGSRLGPAQFISAYSLTARFHETSHQQNREHMFLPHS